MDYNMIYLEANSPSSESIVYAIQYKSLDVKVFHLDFTEASQNVIRTQKLESLPILLIDFEGKKIRITGSRQIIEYLNSFGVQSLYPIRTGRIIRPAKAVLDLQISTNLEPLLFYLLKYSKTGNKRSLSTVTEILKELNDSILSQGNYAAAIIGWPHITVADIYLYPIIDYILRTNSENINAIKYLVNGNNIASWFRNASLNDWAVQGKAQLEHLSRKGKL